ncbi:MAG: hypothetical protein PVJ67_07135 [Candidatus Pacearchaeota archaeon]|jgi:hypothetical protein
MDSKNKLEYVLESFPDKSLLKTSYSLFRGDKVMGTFRVEGPVGNPEHYIISKEIQSDFIKDLGISYCPAESDIAHHPAEADYKAFTLVKKFLEKIIITEGKRVKNLEDISFVDKSGKGLKINFNWYA